MWHTSFFYLTIMLLIAQKLENYIVTNKLLVAELFIFAYSSQYSFVCYWHFSKFLVYSLFQINCCFGRQTFVSWQVSVQISLSLTVNAGFKNFANCNFYCKNPVLSFDILSFDWAKKLLRCGQLKFKFAIFSRLYKECFLLSRIIICKNSTSSFKA